MPGWKYRRPLNLKIPLVLAAVLAEVVGMAALYFLPPYPPYGAGSLEQDKVWMAGQVNPPGNCGTTFRVLGDGIATPEALYPLLTVPPESGSGAGVVTSGGMLIDTPTDAPAGSYIIFFGAPRAGGGWCVDEQGYKYRPVMGSVIRNTAVLPDPKLRLALVITAAVSTALLVFGLGFFIHRRAVRRLDGIRLLAE
jgi:hypothetical protein